MSYSWETCTPNIKEFVRTVQADIKEVCNRNFIGIYLHGSLAMGGFNPNMSDIDILVVTKKPVSEENKRRLAQLFLSRSNAPFPIEVSFLNMNLLHNWQHPCAYDFHYSEYWRERYVDELRKGTTEIINEAINLDPDLAAHITIMNHRGICLDGEPIGEVFPSVPKTDYVSSIMEDYEDCLKNIVNDPIYCSLNLLRVFWYLRDGVISSKQEAGEWGIMILPPEMKGIVQRILDDYSGITDRSKFDVEELHVLRDYILDEVNRLRG
jgi:hypothetical protein